MRFLIDFLYLCGLVLGLPWIIWKMLTTGKYRRGLAQRFGWLPFRHSGRPVIWVHAVSVGELRAAKALVEELRRRHPEHEVVISHTTRTGEEVAAQLFPDLQRFYFPLDLSFATSRVLRLVQPKLVVLVELELWPNFLGACARRKIPVVLANGRISERSGRGYERGAWALRGAFAALTLALMQGEESTQRMLRLFRVMKLPVERVLTAGNIKYDSLTIGRDEALRQSYRELFGFGDEEVVLVCGSTHPGEHEHLPALYREIRAAGYPLRMVVVPRHPERWNDVRKAFRAAEVALVNRTELKESPAMAGAVILLDTMGELSKVYHAADIVFIGGTLIPHGGQNMAEPCGLGIATIIGPSVENFRATVRDLREAEALVEVEDFADLRSALMRLIADAAARTKTGAAALEVTARGRGAVRKHVDAIDGLLK